MALLELTNVRKGFGGVPVLHNINLAIESGEFVAIVGFSGAGKTTLISLVAGLLTPDSGEVKLNGQLVTGPGPDRGIVFQNYSLLPWLSVQENVALAVDQVFPQWSAEQRRAQVDKYLALVNLSAARNKLPRELSGGMRQRVSLARCMAIDPQIMLLDEPLSALDALTRATLQDEILRLRAATGKTVVLITNDPDEGIYLADRIIALTAGPNATLGPSFTVDIERPRDRKAMNHHPRFKELRREVTDFMLDSKRERQVTLTKKLVLPDLEPEDLSRPRAPLFARTQPKRRNEVQEETLEVQ